MKGRFAKASFALAVALVFVAAPVGATTSVTESANPCQRAQEILASAIGGSRGNSVESAALGPALATAKELERAAGEQESCARTYDVSSNSAQQACSLYLSAGNVFARAGGIQLDWIVHNPKLVTHTYAPILVVVDWERARFSYIEASTTCKDAHDAWSVDAANAGMNAADQFFSKHVRITVH
jgi:hypothetical protein